MRREKSAYGVGLINTQKMEEYDKVPEGTLATVVTSKNKYAKRFINMILGKVQMCERYSDLKKYPTSITKECMKYQNRVASAIKPEIFNVPFIGKHAFKIQLEQTRCARSELNKTIEQVQKQRDNLESMLEPLSTEPDVDVKYRLSILTELSRIQNGIQRCEENIQTLKKNASFIQKQIQLETLESIRGELEREASELERKIGGIGENIKNKKNQIAIELKNQKDYQSYVAEIAAMAGEELFSWKKEYEKQTSDKSFEQFKENFGRRRKANETQRHDSESNMIDQMITYKTEHSFGAAANMEGFPEFAAVYDRLRTSEILEYEEKVESARTAAEDEFREQFLAK